MPFGMRLVISLNVCIWNEINSCIERICNWNETNYVHFIEHMCIRSEINYFHEHVVPLFFFVQSQTVRSDTHKRVYGNDFAKKLLKVLCISLDNPPMFKNYHHNQQLLKCTYLGQGSSHRRRSLIMIMSSSKLATFLCFIFIMCYHTCFYAL